MPSVSDPFHPLYLDERDLRAEISRASAICGECRACIARCDAFPQLFTLLDRPGTNPLTTVEQDQVVDACFDCGMCAVGCPQGAGERDDPIDIPRLMARAKQVRVQAGTEPVVQRLASGVRRLSESVRAPFVTRTRFSTWFRQRAESPAASGFVATVALFPTCHVEHHDPDLGKSLVAVYERVGVGCTLPEGLQCCGAPQLDAGDIDAFVALGRRNVRVLAEAVRAGHEIVVPQPACVAVLRDSYPAFVGGSDAELVAEHTHDACAHLVDRLGPGGEADPAAATELCVVDGGAVTVHAPCRVRSQQHGVPAAALLALVGFDVDIVAGCASPDPRVPPAVIGSTVAALAGSQVVVGDCASADRVLTAGGSGAVTHPLQLVARSLGLIAD